MSSTPSKLEGYIIAELSSEFDITNQEALQKVAAALSRAVHTYITTDVEVKVGIPVQVSPATGTGATIAAGKTF